MGYTGLMSTLGRRIAAARIEAGLSQKDLGKRAANVSGAAVWKWESDKVTPGVEVLRAIAEVTGKPLWYLLGDECAPGGNGNDAPTGDLATEARLLRERLEALEGAGRAASPGASELPVQELQRRGIELSPQEVEWLRSYDGAPCETLENAVDLVLLWRTWEMKRQLRSQGTSRS